MSINFPETVIDLATIQEETKWHSIPAKWRTDGLKKSGSEAVGRQAEREGLGFPPANTRLRVVVSDSSSQRARRAESEMDSMFSA